ncbi:MAG: TonB-dependent receptor [Planctomycetes bacterium]|nr:TonB-dependent receptor [Planctomycetota bacterium]
MPRIFPMKPVHVLHAVLFAVITAPAMLFAMEDSPDDNGTVVVVTATAIPRTQDRLGADVTIIEAEELEDLPGIGLDEALARNTPGLEGVVTTDTVPPNVSLRGLPGNYQSQRILVLYDGVPLRDTYTGGFDMRRTSLQDVGRIEIGKGLASHLYGSGAMGGVIQMLPEGPPGEGFESKFSMHGGSFGERGAGLNAGFGGNGSGMRFFGEYSRNDGYLDNSDGSSQWTESVNGGIRGYLPLAGSLSARTGFLFNRLESNGEDFLEDIESETFYTRLAGVEALSDLALWASNEKRALSWRMFPGQDLFFFNSRGARWQGSHAASSSSAVVNYGVEIGREDVESSGVSGTVRAGDTNYAVFAGYEAFAGPQESHGFSAGLRFDYSEDFSGEISPRLSYVYHRSADTQFYAAVGKSYRSPQASDLYLPPTSYMGMTFEGNPNLQPETALGLELGWRQQINGHDISLGAYYTILEDGWDYMMDPDTVFRPHNVTKIIARGAEFSWKWSLPNDIDTVGVTYSFTDSFYEECLSNPFIEGNDVEDVPRHQGRVFFEHVLSRELKASLRIEVVVADERPDDAFGSAFIPAYGLVGVSFGMGDAADKGRFILNVTNALDKDYLFSANPVVPGKPRSFTVGYIRSF